LFLPSETYEWCLRTLNTGGFNEIPEGHNRIDDKTVVETSHYRAYVYLREVIKTHQLTQAFPHLITLSTPTGAYNWIAREEYEALSRTYEYDIELASYQNEQGLEPNIDNDIEVVN
jgi:hypothetical protein